MTATYSAPGKIYISGEHAVIYGGSAIACAIDLRTHVTAKKADIVSISSNMIIGPKITELNFDNYPYVSSAIEKICNDKGVSIDIKSNIPIGSGLGSSAAVTVATLAAINKEFKFGYEKDEIARMGYEIEKDVQGIASPTDTFVSTFGGIVEMPSLKYLPTLDCDIVIGNTNRIKDTAKLINKVKMFKEEFPEVVDPIIKTIDSLSKKEVDFLIKKDYASLGRLMNVNHCLLEALGVCTAELSALVYAARNAGAFGAKITGAGGGGCMVALASSPNKVANAIETAGGSAIITKPTIEGIIQEFQGIKIEKSNFCNIIHMSSRDMNNHTRRILDEIGITYSEDENYLYIEKFKH